MTTRPAAVAGTFYPASPLTLSVDVQEMLAGREASFPAGPEEAEVRKAEAPKALIVPHAGYVYSGPVAASAYRLLEGAVGISRVVILGPAHRVHVRGIAVPVVDHFATPVGDVTIDQVAIAGLEAFPWVVRSDAAHELEHCIEVQLPFLQTVLGDFSLVPLVVGECGGEEVGEVIESLWGGPETLVVVSSDLSHYLPYEEAQEADELTSRAILSRFAHLRGEQACGAFAINGLMRVAQARELTVEPLDLRNSGDTAGDRSQVVGYGAYALY